MRRDGLGSARLTQMLTTSAPVPQAVLALVAGERPIGG